MLRSLVSPDQPNTKTLDELKTLLRAHSEPKPLVISERFHFYRRNQLAGESVTDFLVELRRLAAQCEFKNFLDEALRDWVVGGLKIESIQRRLLLERNLDLAKAVEIATAMELADKQSQSFQVPLAQAQVEVKRVSGASPVCKEKPRNEDRFKEVICFKCNKKGHFARNCRSKKKYTPRGNLEREAPRQKKTMNWVGDQESSGEEATVQTVYVVESGRKNQRR